MSFLDSKDELASQLQRSANTREIASGNRLASEKKWNNNNINESIYKVPCIREINLLKGAIFMLFQNNKYLFRLNE